MPLVDDNGDILETIQPVTAPVAAITPQVIEKPIVQEETKPSFTDTLEASFRTYNDLSIAADLISKDRTKKNTDFNVGEALQISGIDPKYLDHFEYVDSPQEFSLAKQRLDEELRDKEIIDRAGWKGIASNLLAGVASPTTWIYGGALIKGLKWGTKIVKSALTVAGVSGGVEYARQKTAQDVRPTLTNQEVYLNTMATVAFAGMVGAGGAAFTKYMGNKASSKIQNDIKSVINDYDELGPLPVTPSEQVAFHAKLNDYEAKGLTYDPALTKILRNGKVSEGLVKAAKVVSTGWNTPVRMMEHPSDMVRDTFLKMADPAFKPELVKTTAFLPPVEAGVKLRRQKYIGENVRPFNSLYDSYAKITPKNERLSAEDFRTASLISHATGNSSGIEQVDAFAKIIKSFYDKSGKELVETGLLHADTVSSRPKYFNIIYKKGTIKRDLNGFKNKIRPQFIANLTAQNPKLSKEEIAKMAEKSVQNTVDSITGAAYSGLAKPGKAAPLKERKTDIDPLSILDYIETDALHLMDVYQKKTGPKVEFAKRFFKTETVDGVEVKVPETYADIAQKIKEEYQPKIDAADPKKALKLQNERDKVVHELEAQWDLQMGTFQDHNGAYASHIKAATNAMLAYNYTIRLGQVVVASIGDPLMVPLREGYKTWFGKTLPRTIAGMTKAVGNKITGKDDLFSYSEAKAALKAFETEQGNRVSQLFDLGDPNAIGNPFENFLAKTGQKASNFFGINQWNDSNQAIAVSSIRYRIMHNLEESAKGKKLDLREEQFMNEAGIGINDRLPLWDVVSKSLKRDSLGDIVPSFEDLPPEVADKLLMGLGHHVDNTLIMKGASDLPKFGNTLMGRVLGQWQSFNFAIFNKVLVRGAQDADGRTAIGLAGLVGGGMMIEALKNKLAGEDNPTTPEGWIAAGLDRSGLTGLLAYGNNFTSLVGLDAKRLKNDKWRYDPTRAIVGALGPAGKTAKDLFSTAEAGLSSTVGNDRITQKDANTALGLIPFYGAAVLHPIKSYVKDEYVSQLPESQKKKIR